MRIVCISDTHGMHNGLSVPDGDVIIHAGDITDDIGQVALRSFLSWFSELPHAHKVFIAGNHDGAFEKWPEQARKMVETFAPNVTYLQDGGVEIDGLKFWGSPVTPAFCDWHFNRQRGDDIRRHWDLIPNDTDVLVTHGPARYPNSTLDMSGFDNEKVGCRDLYEAMQRVKPDLHVFGHIHHGYGVGKFIHDDGWKTHLVNASICDEAYRPINAPIVVEIQ